MTKSIIFGICLLGSSILLGQPAYQPLIHNISPDDYQIGNNSPGPQNWEFEQDLLGNIYVSNNYGILQFDGSNWRLIGKPEEIKRPILKKSPEQIIYTGREKKLGMLEISDQGELVLKNLSHLIPDSLMPDINIKNICILHTKIIFIGSNHLFVYQPEDQTMTTISAPGEIRSTFVVGKQLLIEISGEGIYTWKGENEIETTIFSKKFTRSFIREILPSTDPVKQGTLIVFTQTDGIFQLGPEGEIRNIKLPELHANDNEVLAVQRLTDGNIAIGTSKAGLFITDEQGNILNHLDKTSGLGNNKVLGIYQDMADNIWLGLDEGITVIQYPLDLLYFGEKNGLEGTVLSIFQQEATLYVGTTLGLYKAKVDQHNYSHYQFEKVRLETAEVWKIISWKGDLWVASSKGLFVNINDRWVKKSKTYFHFSLTPSRFYKDRLYVGNNKGIFFVEAGPNNTYSSSQPLIVLDHSVRSMVEIAPDQIWGGYTNISLVRLADDGSYLSSKTLKRMVELDEKYTRIEIVDIDHRVRFSGSFGIAIYDSLSGTLIPDTTLGELFSTNGKAAYAATQDKDGLIWLSGGKRQIGYLKQNGEESYNWNYKMLNPVNNYLYSIFIAEPDFVWMGLVGELYRYNKKSNKQSSPTNRIPQVNIREVSINEDSTIFYGIDKPKLSDSKLSFPSPISHDTKEFLFQYSSPEFILQDRVTYSYRLIGFDNKWSEWKAETQKTYTGLREGKYTFEVKARNVYENESEIARFSFRLSPPWYRSPLAYVFYGIALIGFIIMLLRYQSSRHEAKLKQKENELAKEREIADRLRKFDRLKDEFLANTSHELKTPLTGIIGMAEGIYNKLDGEDKTGLGPKLQLILASGKRLSSLVDDIMDYSRLKSRDLTLYPKAIDAHALVEVVIQQIRHLAEAKKLELQNQISAETIVWADENRLIQIFYNLIGNAIKFSDKGTISISAQSEKAKTSFSVKDQGIGISKDKQEEIFQAFEQADGSNIRSYGGTGLGLSITKNLIELHGGSISVNSEKGIGSEFIFSIPTSQEKKPKTMDNPIANSPIFLPEPVIGNIPDNEGPELVNNDPSEQVNILIVDDEPINQAVLQNLLDIPNYKITTAIDGLKALEFIESGQKFDLVLLDIMMPRMSGYEVCNKIREYYLPSELPVIMVTAKNQIKDLVEGLNVGANDYVSKPFARDEFLARVKTQLNLHKINETTGKFVPNHFIKALGKDNITEVLLGDQVEREVTVMFSDIRDYTTLSEEMSPEDNFRFVSKFVGLLGPIIQDNHGFVNQYLGDAIMALFLEKPEDALLAAINMQQAVRMYSTTRELEGKQKLQIGIGMHTGKLIMGIIGDQSRFEASTIADSVNTASRLESLTKYYGASILISEKTYRKIPNIAYFNHRYLGMVQVKGKQEIINIYEFFDGEEEQQIDLKYQSRQLFREGLNNYYTKNFKDAVLAFKKILKDNPHDTAAKQFLKNAELFERTGVDTDWDGVEKIFYK